MRVVVLGGTRFIGRRIVADLAARGDEVLVVHRGETEPAGLAETEHLHADRGDFAAAAAGRVAAFGPDAVIDTMANSRATVDGVLPHLPDTQLVMLSSMDVYRAFGLVRADREGEPMPLDETSPVRTELYINGVESGYEKLDVEPAYLARGGTVLRLPMVYGEHDTQLREEFVLRRVRAGRRRIPVGAASWLWTRCHVGDVSGAVLAALGNAAASGEIVNIGEPVTRSVRGWAEQILAAAGHEAELVTVPDSRLPKDMWITANVPQHLVFQTAKARAVLGWQPGEVMDGIRASVRWHLANPPADGALDTDAEEAALAAAEAPAAQE